MSKPAFIKILAVVAATAAIFAVYGASCAPRPRRADVLTIPDSAAQVFKTAVVIPAGTYRVGSREPGCFAPREVVVRSYALWPVEVPLAWWRQFRMDTNTDADAQAMEEGDMPATGMSYDDAMQFCRWFSDRCGVAARLPTADEWQVAARSGKAGMPYPWGWEDPSGRAAFRAEHPDDVTSHRPTPWGLYNMSGNVAEWCEAIDNGHAPVMGGSWAERDPAYLRISHRLIQPGQYRDRDVGFRIAFDVPDGQETVARTSPVCE